MRAIYTPRGRALEYSPLALNLYSGCVHGCRYCYAPACLRRDRAAFHGSAAYRPELLVKLEKDLAELPGDSPPVLLCFTSDPYQGDHFLNVATRNALRLFYEYDHYFQILTKGGMKAWRDFDLYGDGCAFGTTLTFIDPGLSRNWEPNAALPSERIEAIRRAKAAKITTWVSFEPVLDADQVFGLLEETAEYVDLYKVGKCSGPFSAVTDWAAFGHEIEARLKAAGKAYYLKEDLRLAMGG